MSPKVTWLSFTHFSLNPAYVVTDPVEIFFVVSWGMCCCLGWCLEPQKCTKMHEKPPESGVGTGVSARFVHPLRYSQLFAAIAGVDPLALPEHLTHQLLRHRKGV